MKNPRNEIIKQLSDLRLSDNTDREDMIARLCDVIDEELDKPKNKRNIKLVEECFVALEKLSPDQPENRDEVIKDGLARIMSSCGNKNTDHCVSRPRHYTLGIRILAAALVALCVFLIAGSLTVAAGVAKYDSFEAWFDSVIVELIRQGPGSYEVDGVTVVIGKSQKKYESIEGFLKEENYDISYPGDLPEGTTIEKVTVDEVAEGEWEVSFMFNQFGSFTVYNFDIERYSIVNMEQIEINGITYGVIEGTHGRYQAQYVTDEYAYVIIHPNYEDLIYILEHTKGIES